MVSQIRALWNFEVFPSSQGGAQHCRKRHTNHRSTQHQDGTIDRSADGFRFDFIYKPYNRFAPNFLFPTVIGFQKQLNWIRSSLLTACSARLGTYAGQEFRHPITCLSLQMNVSCPIVPWTEVEASALRSEIFLYLLDRVGLFPRSAQGALYPRIPREWSADTVFSVALIFGPVSQELVDFDLSLCKHTWATRFDVILPFHTWDIQFLNALTLLSVEEFHRRQLRQDFSVVSVSNRSFLITFSFSILTLPLDKNTWTDCY